MSCNESDSYNRDEYIALCVHYHRDCQRNFINNRLEAGILVEEIKKVSSSLINHMSV